MKHKNKFYLVSLVFLVAMQGCGGGGSGDSGSTNNTSAIVSGSVVKGYIANATVNVYTLKSDGSRGSNIGSGVTGTSGEFSVTISSLPSIPYLAETSGGVYKDEATASNVNLTSNDHLCVVIPGNSTNFAISSLTHMACKRAVAVAANGVALADAVASANAGVAQQYNLSDIVSLIPVDATNATDNQTATQNARMYGIVLAGISNEANTMGLASGGAFALTQALAADLEQDGKLDGKDGLGTAVPIPNNAVNLVGTEGLNDLQVGIDTFLGDPSNQTGLSSTSIDTSAVDVGIANTGAMYVTSGALPNWVYDVNASASVTVSGGSSPYSCSISSGSLPSGLSLANANTGCTISGTIASAGGETTNTISPLFSVTITDSAMNNVSVDLFVNVVPAPPSIIAITSGVCYQSTYCSISIASATSSLGTVYLVSNQFPNAMAIDTIGYLSGIAPNTTGVHSFQVCAVDILGSSTCTETSFTVDSAIKSFNGSYSGGYNGTVYITGTQQNYSVSDANFSITISDGIISGYTGMQEAINGTVNSNGSVSMNASMTLGNSTCNNVSFSGTAAVDQQGQYANGNWSCTASDGNTASGTWSIAVPIF